jgi:glucose/arabinose dehydrogenase
MKRLIWTVIGAVLLVALIWAGVFYWRHLRGAGPAFTGPPRDIAQLMEKAKGPGELNGPARNTTGFPLQLPPGFSISIFAQDLGKPRVLTLDPSGTLLASIPSQGRIVALPDGDGDGKADKVVTVVGGLNRPHGFAFHPQAPTKLYIAEVEQLALYDYHPQKLKAAKKRKIAALPSGRNRHWTRTVLFSPDAQRLLVSVGSSCDTCVEKDPRHGTIQVVDADGGNLEPFATGLRNAVFMTRHPVTGQVWVTEMGRDYLGDDLPPDEINVVQEGKDYGWPWCYGKQVHDSVFDPGGKNKAFCKETVPSYLDLQAHSAPLGLAFVPATPAWPQEYHHDLLVAYHGSWNRTIPTGYKVMRFKLDAQGKYLGREDFITGWLTKEGALGRPVDILIRPDGVMYISDDKAGVVYRVKYGTGS